MCWTTSLHLPAQEGSTAVAARGAPLTYCGAIVGGCRNSITAGGGRGTQPSPFIGAGRDNTVAVDLGVIVGGDSNYVAQEGAVIVGGYHNSIILDAVGPYAFIGGGRFSTAAGEVSFIGGGDSNYVGHIGDVIVGGVVNSAMNTYDFVGGGYHNTAGGTGNDTATVIAGGWGNTASTGFASILGGRNNTANGEYSSIGGGHNNSTENRYTTVSSGFQGGASADYGTVGGGRVCKATATAAGGWLSTASGQYATVAGGAQDTASGRYSMIPGGYTNRAAGAYSFAAGYRAKAAHKRAFTWADSSNHDFLSAAINEFAARCTGGVRFVTGIDPYDGLPVAGVQIASGDGSWSSISDRNLKENFTPVNGEALLQKLSAIPMTTWNWVSQDASIRHIGPMAQDFFAAFRVGEDDRHKATVDADGVALAAIQQLYDTQQELTEKVQRVEHLETKVARLETLVETLLAQQGDSDKGEAEFSMNR